MFVYHYQRRIGMIRYELVLFIFFSVMAFVDQRVPSSFFFWPWAMVGCFHAFYTGLALLVLGVNGIEKYMTQEVREKVTWEATMGIGWVTLCWVHVSRFFV